MIEAREKAKHLIGFFTERAEWGQSKVDKLKLQEPLDKKKQKDLEGWVQHVKCCLDVIEVCEALTGQELEFKD